MYRFDSRSLGLFFSATTHSVQNRPWNQSLKVGISEPTLLAAYCAALRALSTRRMSSLSARSAASLVVRVPLILTRLPSSAFTCLRYLHALNFTSNLTDTFILPARRGLARSSVPRRGGSARACRSARQATDRY